MLSENPRKRSDGVVWPMSAMLVTGYVPLEGHPRSHEEYQQLFEKLQDVTPLLKNSLYFFQHGVEDCWLYRYLEFARTDPTHSVADNPKKNTLAYHIVQHEKITWLARCALRYPNIKVFAWIDMGIMSVPGITVEMIADAMGRAEQEKTIAIPGCWNEDFAAGIPDEQVNWRFCGGFMVVPRVYLADFEMEFRTATVRHIRRTNNVSWEVNTLHRMEADPAVKLPIWWYSADHNGSIVSNYNAMMTR